MAGRCGCSSSNATGASLTGGSCISVSGAGTTASPAIISAEIDPDPSNNLQCGGNGLYAATAQVDGGDCIAVTGDGSLATPYELAPTIDPDARNLLECGGDGLLATPDPLYGQSTGAYLGGAAPLTGLIRYVGQTVVTTDASGFATINLPAPFPTGFVTVVYSFGDLTGVVAIANISAGDTTLGSFKLRVQDPAGAAVVGNLRINWEATGW